jgi:UDP-N-acetylglucosamine 2-epimerase (non-hydrolysing)
MNSRFHVICVVGARPNFVKVAPALNALRGFREIDVKLIHTGQHYDDEMSEQFFRQLNISRPDFFLDVGSSSHAQQTALVMQRIEPILIERNPDVVMVFGDVNSTLAAALTAMKLHFPVAHVEAGLRSFDRRMPEEVNRIIVDQISDLLYTTERSAHHNLAREGIPESKITFVGNLMIDSLVAARSKAPTAEDQLRSILGSQDAASVAKGYALLTLHRQSNVDDAETLVRFLTAIRRIADLLPVIFPIHPRTRSRIAALEKSGHRLDPRVLALPPAGYLQMLGLMQDARLVLTDSGGIQEETTALGVPCLTLRENTERPVTIEQGTNSLVGSDPHRIYAEAQRALSRRSNHARIPEGWDGMAAKRLAAHLSHWLERRRLATAAAG